LKISPVYAMLLGALFLGEKVSWKEITLTVVMLFGLYYLGTEGTFVFGSFSLGFAKLLLVPLLWGIGHALTKPLLENHTISPIQIIVVRSSIISVVIGGTTIILHDISFLGNALRVPEYLFFSLLMGGTYFFMHISWYNSITCIDLGYASALVTPSPAITTILAVSLGLETLQIFDIFGMSIVFISLFGLIWVNKMRSGRSK
ncbi:MAG: EamA family transporter, partial [Promethearchaeota archaeon]